MKYTIKKFEKPPNLKGTSLQGVITDSSKVHFDTNKMTPVEYKNFTDKANGRAEVADSPIDWIIGLISGSSLIGGLSKRMAASPDVVVSTLSSYPKIIGAGLGAVSLAHEAYTMGGGNSEDFFYIDKKKPQKDKEILIDRKTKTREYKTGGRLIPRFQNPKGKLPLLPKYQTHIQSSESTYQKPSTVQNIEQMKTNGLRTEKRKPTWWESEDAQPPKSNVSESERLTTNAKEALRIINRASLPLQGAAAITMAAPVVVSGLVNPGTWSTLGRAAIGGAAVDGFYHNIGGENLGDALDIKNPTGRMMANMVSPGMLAGYNPGKQAFQGAKTMITEPKILNSKRLLRQIKKEPIRPLHTEELNLLRKELEQKGILDIQKTWNMPYKEALRKGIEPWGYTDGGNGVQITGSKRKDVLGYIFGGKNPWYKTEEEISKIVKDPRHPFQNHPVFRAKTIREAVNMRDVARMANTKNSINYANRPDLNRQMTWNHYLGNSQSKYPLYDVSELSTNKNLVYTIKEGMRNIPRLKDNVLDMIEDVNKGISKGSKSWRDHPYKIIDNNNWKILDNDVDYFGTMGGFNWDISRLNNGNFKFIANDIWDLQPFKSASLMPIWMQKNIAKVTSEGVRHHIELKQPYKIAHKLIKNIEVGKTLGIGKPLDVKVGFEFDNLGNIVRQFKKGNKINKINENTF